ncbi:hypothetical protein MIR68_007306 [Amoeboaphelidium protococcarum]|nr:hypothetical protein MIR68_007306 [Amoeboaphelidium protococcarum]
MEHVENNRKQQQKESAEYSRTTLHVRNIPLDCEQQELEAFFSEVGPIRFCFIIAGKKSKDGVKQQSSAYGFVQYLVPEDAEKALSMLQKVKFSGVNLKLSYSKHRHRADKMQPCVPTEDPSKSAVDAASKYDMKREQIEFIKQMKHNARLVIVEGRALSKDAVENIQSIAETHCGKVSEVEYPYHIYSLSSGKEEKTIVESRCALLFLDPAVAKSAPGVLNKNESFTKLGLKAYASVLLQDAKRDYRIMIKNLPFKFSQKFKSIEECLLSVLQQYGYAVEITVPKREDGKMLGYAFVSMSDDTAVQLLIEQLHSKACKQLGNRRIQIQKVLPKNQYLRQKQQIAEESAVNDQPAADEVPLAEDDAEQSNSEEELSDIETVSPSSGPNDILIMSDDSEDEDVEQDAQGDHLSRKREQQHFDDQGTVFVRNLPFDSTEQQVFKKFSQFGPVKYVKIVKDQMNGKSKGSAFVCYYKSPDAEKVLEEASKVSPSLMQQMSRFKFMPEMSSGVHIGGRVLNVLRAVDRHQAEKLRSCDDEQASDRNENGVATKRKRLGKRERSVFKKSKIDKVVKSTPSVDTRRSGTEKKSSYGSKNGKAFNKRKAEPRRKFQVAKK